LLRPGEKLEQELHQLGRRLHLGLLDSFSFSNRSRSIFAQAAVDARG
jgi:hypothetical protein